jgi:hypothetical protein
MFGSINFEKEFRKMLFEYMLTIPEEISPILQEYETRTLEDYVSEMLTKVNSWGSFVEIMASRLFIHREIFIISTDGNNYLPQKPNDFLLSPIYIYHSSSTHFDPLFKKNLDEIVLGIGNDSPFKKILLTKGLNPEVYFITFMFIKILG